MNDGAALGWNLLMTGVLVVTVVPALLAAPSPFRQIMGDPSNACIAGFPYVWLPLILVLLAWLGHIILFRRQCLRKQKRTQTQIEAGCTERKQAIGSMLVCWFNVQVRGDLS